MIQDTFAQCLTCWRRRDPAGKCYSTLSGRSSQVNSHSGNTDSACSRQSSLRLFDSELATRRPLVVSFRKPPVFGDRKVRSGDRFKYGNSLLSLETNIESSFESIGRKNKLKVISVLDTEIPDSDPFEAIYDNDSSPNGIVDIKRDMRLFGTSIMNNHLNTNGREDVKRTQKNTRHKIKNQQEIIQNLLSESKIENGHLVQGNIEYQFNKTINQLNYEYDDANYFSEIEMQTLQPTHICPLSKTNTDYPKIEDIEIFHTQTFKINKREAIKRHKRYHKGCKENRKMPKSLTFSHEDQNNEEQEEVQKTSPKKNKDRRNSVSCIKTMSTDPSSTTDILIVKD